MHSVFHPKLLPARLCAFDGCNVNFLCFLLYGVVLSPRMRRKLSVILWVTDLGVGVLIFCTKDSNNIKGILPFKHRPHYSLEIGVLCRNHALRLLL